MIDLSKLLPPDCQNDPSQAAEQLLRAAMMRVNFIPGVRQRLGWRGMRACPQSPMSQTAKIVDQEGVYGLKPEGSAINDHTAISTFSLFYFPQKDEDPLDDMSLAAGMAAYSPQYSDIIRDFPNHDHIASLFQIADIELRYRQGEQLTLSLVAPQKDLVVAVDGVFAEIKGEQQMLVAPGDMEQTLACLDLANPFFETLAASLSYIFSRAPKCLSLQSCAHSDRLAHGDGRIETRPSSDNRLMALRLTWRLDEADDCRPEAKIDNREWRNEDLTERYRDAKWWNPLVPGARHSMDKSTMGIEELPKLIVLTGFLGAGKTSFLSHFIEYQASRNLFVAVIQNEIGEKGLDARLLGQHYAVKEIDEGCICCTLIDNLTAAIEEICSQYQPDFIILETTGLANPANLLSELSELQDRLEFCSITCMLDALNGAKALPNYAILQDQIRVADTVLINKKDLADQTQIAHLHKIIRDLNPFCAIHETCEGDISPREIYGVNFEGKHHEANQAVETCGCSHDGHDHQCVTHHHYGIHSLLWRPTGRVRKDHLEAFLLGLPPTILRVKGLLYLDGQSQLTLCQHVPNSVQMTPYRGQDNPSEFLVFIGEEPEQAIKALDALIELN